MADEKKATHSLSTEIEMLFKTSGIQDLVGNIDEISQKVYGLTEPVKTLTKSFEGLNDSPVKNLVRTLENFSIDSVKFNASSLRKVLENKIATAITKSQIEFIGDEGTERYPFKIKMGADFWEKNQKNITEAMAKSFSNFVVDTGKLPPLDNTEILKEFQKKFNEQIVELIKDNEVFSLYTYDPNTKVKKFKYKQKFKLDRTAVDSIMSVVEEKFTEYLSDPKNLELEDLPKLKINSVSLKQAMLRIEESIGNIDDLVGVDADTLKNLPNIETKLVKFRDKLIKMIEDINQLAIQLNSITFGKATDADVKQAIEAIEKLKGNVILQIDKWTKDIGVEIESNLNVKPDLGVLKESINNLNVYFSNIFKVQLDKLKSDVETVLTKSQAQVEGEAVEDPFKGKKIDITQSVLDVITEKLLNKDIPIKLNTASVDELLLKWAGDFNIALNEELNKLTGNILSGMSSILEDVSNNFDIIISTTQQDLFEMFSNNENPVISSEDIQKMLGVLKDNLTEYIKQSLSRITLTNLVEKDISVQLPESFSEDVKYIIDNNIRDFIKDILANYKTEGLNSIDITGSISELNKQSDMIVNAVLRGVDKILTDIRTQFINSFDKQGDSTKGLASEFNSKTQLVITSYINYLENLLNNLIIKESTDLGKEDGEITKLTLRTKALQNNINSLIQKIVNEKAKQITAYGNELLNGISLDEGVFQKLKVSLDSVVDNIIGGYGIAAEKLSSSSYTDEELNNIYNKLLNGFKDSLSEFTDSILSGIKGVSTGKLTVTTDKLNPQVKKALADSLGVSVKDFTKAFPTLEGKEAQDAILKQNVQLILNSLNDFVGSSIKEVIMSYQNSIKNIDVGVDVESNKTFIDYINKKLKELQDAILAKAKQMVKDQFKYLTEEIKSMNIEAKSLGYKPTKAFVNEVSKATGTVQTLGNQMKVNIQNASMQGADVVARGLKVDSTDTSLENTDKLVTNASSVVVDGKVVDLKIDEFPIDQIKAPITNYLKEGYPFSVDTSITPPISTVLKDISSQSFLPENVYGRGYSPMDIDNILFKQVAKADSGPLKGIISSMAKYFIVGYMMRLPMKAITDANKVASELDYYIAKAQQDILIKDPKMIETAQKVVYERYKEKGMDVSLPKFKTDVNKEAASLRNMMQNEMQDYLLNISKAYYQDVADVGRFYSVASRRAKNPYDALTKTKEIAKISAVEDDLDTELAATGLDSISAQWGVPTGNLDRYINMLLKTAMLSNTTVSDLLMAQRDTGAMFKYRLKGMDDEKAFATSMALSSMFVESTAKSGQQAGTFWKNVLQRPYTKEGREFLKKVSSIDEFKDLNPYIKDETGKKVQKDFLTMFSNILETTLKVDDPSSMIILSELFPTRTIGGVESISTLVGDLRTDLENSIQILKDTGQLDKNATLETVNIKDVINKYVENILGVSDEDIGTYLAGLQDTSKFAFKGMETQWQSTVYSVFGEMKEESSEAMIYLTAILRKFENNSSRLSEVIGVFAKIGVGLLGKSMIDKLIDKGMKAPIKPTDVQRVMAEKYMSLQTSEKGFNLRRAALGQELSTYTNKMQSLNDDIVILQDKRQQLHSFITDTEGKGNLTQEDEFQLNKAHRQRNMYDDELIKLRNTYGFLEKESSDLSDKLADVEKSYTGTVQLGQFLKGSMGARNVKELKGSFTNYLRNETLYPNIAPLVLRGKLTHSDEWYTSLQNRKAEIEDELINQQKSLLQQVNNPYKATSPEELESILGKGYGDTFYAMGNRVSPDTVQAMRKLTDHFGSEYGNMRKSFEKTYKELNSINSELVGLNTERLEVERAIFEAERPVFKGYTKVEGVNVPVTEPRTPEQKVQGYRGLLSSFGVKVDDFEAGMDKLAGMFKNGKFDVDQYEDSLRDVASQLGISDRDFDKFKSTIRELNSEIETGKQGIYDYITALEMASTKSGKIKAGSTVTGNETEETETSSGEKSKNDLFGLGVLALSDKKGGIVEKFKGLGKGLLVSLKALGLKIPQLAALYAITEAIGSLSGGFVERGMTDSERLSLEADKLESTINKATGWKINKNDKPIEVAGKKIGALIGSRVGGAFNQLNRLAGGTSPSFKETIDIWKEGTKKTGLSRDELGTQLKEKYGVETKRYKGNYERQLEYLNKNPFVDPVTGELRDKNDPNLLNLPLDDLMEFLDKRMKDLNKSLTESDALFTKEKVKLLVSGLSNNSEQMRQAIREHLDRNISEMTKLMNELKEYLPNLVPGTDSYRTMWLQILDLEDKISESELQQFENSFSQFDEIMERYDRNSTGIQSKYDVLMYDANIAGINKDSAAIKQIEKKMAEDQVRMISGIQSKLEALRQKYEDKPEQREKILLQIQQLEADKKRILSDLKDKLTEGLSTFNLPSGIQPITYYEAMTRSNNYKNMTVRSGDAVVNVNITNMNGNDADINKLSRSVSNAVTQAQKNMVRQFANDVKSGMGNNYLGWNNY